MENQEPKRQLAQHKSISLHDIDTSGKDQSYCKSLMPACAVIEAEQLCGNEILRFLSSKDGKFEFLLVVALAGRHG